MCNSACILFGEVHLSRDEVMGKKVIEVGAVNVNGSLRASIEALQPLSYLGVDISEGPGVDEKCDINDLIEHYGKESFDVVVSAEVMEHVRNWRSAVSNMKNILKPNGVLILTTRSKSFPYHGYPFDFWRYEVEDMLVIFSDFLIEALEKDPLSPGVFVKARKPAVFCEQNLERYSLFSIVRDRPCRELQPWDILLFKTKRLVRSLLSKTLPAQVKAKVKRMMCRAKGA